MISVKRMLAMRDTFTAPPTEDFHERLNKVEAQYRNTSVHRGEGAWRPKVASTQEAQIRRDILRELNKLTPEKYNIISTELHKPLYVSSIESINILSQLLFEKALHEPPNAFMYASLAKSLTKFEISEMMKSENKNESTTNTNNNSGNPTSSVDNKPANSKAERSKSEEPIDTTKEAQVPSKESSPTTTAATTRSYASVLAKPVPVPQTPPPTPDSNKTSTKSTNSPDNSKSGKGDSTAPKSRLRRILIQRTVTHFQSTYTPPEGLTGEALEDDEKEFRRRKSANINFVGLLYLHDMLPTEEMVEILTQTLKADPPALSNTDIEVACSLIKRIGLRLEKKDRGALERTLRRMQEIRDKDVIPRVKVFIENLFEMSTNGWKCRVERADEQTPTTLQAQTDAAVQKARDICRNPGTPHSPNRRGPASNSSSTTTPSSLRDNDNERFSILSRKSPNSKAPTNAWSERLLSAPNSAFQKSEKRKTPKQMLDEFVGKLTEEWMKKKTDNDSICLPNWRAEVPDGVTNTDVIAFKIREACHPHKDHEAAVAFLTRGLGLDTMSLTKGLALAQCNAVREGLEDIPMFSTRFAEMLRALAALPPVGPGEPMNPITVLRTTLEQLSVDDNVESLLSVWEKLKEPLTIAEFLKVVDNMRTHSNNNSDIENVEKCVAYLIYGLLEVNSNVKKEDLKKWLSSSEATSQYKNVADMVSELLEKN